MTDTDDGSFALNVAHSEAARLWLDRTMRYLRWGRIYGGCTDGDLTALWITAMCSWAARPAERPLAIDEAEAEFALLDREPPYAFARDEIGHVAARTMADLADMAAAERCAAGERILDLYRDEVARKN
ncbi:hypothetical protein [Methylobacterium sp. NEAU K]|uniref:hypothetical protein n=1 Tax=Methylobacterium sp. NEAU K TaxID=3064946 RepID=UPI002736F50F|nr:hypothetical protein [Methylobacterium sp. NEAU K]MDP4003545.1 hypothetical protein [Methylobacterium sp. NEAU K]